MIGVDANFLVGFFLFTGEGVFAFDGLVGYANGFDLKVLIWFYGGVFYCF
jgi:hypothetical protein